MPSKLRIGLVGTGDIGRIHAAALAKVPGVEVVVAKGRNPERAVALAEEIGGSVAGDFAALLSDASVAALDICVPNDLHAAYVLEAIQAGKHVLCEKPIALNLADAERMVQAAADARLHLMIGHTLRFWPEYRLGREAILSGRIGRVQAFSARRMLSLLRAVQGEAGWRQAGARSGGAALDLQIHDIDFVLWTFGLPKSVFSRGVRSSTGAYDHVYTLLEYADGPAVAIESSFMLSGNPVVMDFRAVGSDGSLEFAFVESEFAMHDLHAAQESEQVRKHPALLLYRWEQPRTTLAEQTADPVVTMFEAEARTFTELVQNGRHPEAPAPAEAVDALRVALASRQSCETGKPVEL